MTEVFSPRRSIANLLFFLMSHHPRTCSCHGRRIGYEAGEPDDGTMPLMVFLPPGASSAAIWRPIAAHFKDRFRTAAINPSGYGETEAFDGPAPMTILDEAEAVAAVIRAELSADAGHDIPEGGHLVGHSYGGAIALEVARHWPDLVVRLTLFEPAPYPLLREAGEEALAAAITGENESFVAMVRGERPGGSAKAMAQYLDFFNNQPGFWRGLDNRAQAKMLLLAERLAACLNAVGHVDISREGLSKIEVPATVVHGAKSDRLHIRLSEIVSAALCDATLRSVPGAGHMMTLTHGEAVCVLIDESLAAV